MLIWRIFPGKGFFMETGIHPVLFGLAVVVMVVVAAAVMRIVSKIIMAGIWLVILAAILLYCFGHHIGFRHGWHPRAQQERPYSPGR